MEGQAFTEYLEGVAQALSGCVAYAVGDLTAFKVQHQARLEATIDELDSLTRRAAAMRASYAIASRNAEAMRQKARALAETTSSLLQEVARLAKEEREMKSREKELDEQIQRRRSHIRTSDPKTAELVARVRAEDWRIQHYASMLRMKFVPMPEQGQLKIVFTGLKPGAPEREYWAAFDTRAEGFQLAGISDEIPGLQDALQDVAITGNMPYLIRRIRRGFLQVAEAQ